MEDIISTFFSQAEFLFLCILSLILGSVIGLEREYKKKPAGFKTHVLICLGATIIMYISLHLSPLGDPGRIAAQIVSGIGFIGAGTIMQSRQVIQGLTTAATLWIVAAIGMLVGGSFIMPSIFVTILVGLFLLLSSKYVSMGNGGVHAYTMHLKVEKLSAIDQLEKLLSRLDIVVDTKSIRREKEMFIELSYHATPPTDYLFFRKVMKLDGLSDIIKL